MTQDKLGEIRKAVIDALKIHNRCPKHDRPLYEGSGGTVCCPGIEEDDKLEGTDTRHVLYKTAKAAIEQGRDDLVKQQIRTIETIFAELSFGYTMPQLLDIIRYWHERQPDDLRKFVEVEAQAAAKARESALMEAIRKMEDMFGWDSLGEWLNRKEIIEYLRSLLPKP